MRFPMPNQQHRSTEGVPSDAVKAEAKTKASTLKAKAQTFEANAIGLGHSRN